MSAAVTNSTPPPTAHLRRTPRPDLAVALVYLRAQAGGDFFSDVPFAWSAGELRRDGVRADLFELRYERGEAAYNRALDADLLARLAAGGYGLVVVESCWQPELIDAVHDLGAWLCETALAAVHPDRHVDFVLRHFTRDRQPLRALVARLQAGDALAGLPNVRAWSPADGQMIALGAEHAVPETPAARLPFCPVEAPIRIGVAMDLRGDSPPVRRSLDTNDGCPFSKPVAKNPAFDGVDLSAPDITLAGCSFCFMGGDYRALPAVETVRLHVDQMAAWQQTAAGLDEIVLRDQHAIRYLPDLLRTAIARGLKPVGVLVPGRGDAILRYADALKEAASVAAGTGFWFALYLIGFESFSEPQLQRYNKGVTADEYALALRNLRALHARHPNSFRLYAYGSSSFILWEPWTTLDDLAANVAFIETHAVARLSSGLAATRLRLYPNLPLYWRAQRDDLLVPGAAATDRGAAQTGYAAEARWRTADGRVAVVEELVRRLLQHTRAQAQVGVVKAATAWAGRRWSQPLPALDAGDLSPDAGDTSAAAPRQAATRTGVASESEAQLRHTIATIEASWLRLRTEMNRGAPRTTASAARGATSTMAKRGAATWQDQAATWQAERRQAAEAISRRAAETVQLGAGCNNRCVTCIGRHDHHEVDTARLREVAEKAGKTGGKLTFTGREPTLVPGLLQVVRAGRRAGANGVELVSNGRALATPGVVAKLERAGVTHLLLKRHRLADDAEDTYVQAPGAGAQLRAALARINASGLRWRALLIPTSAAPEELAALVQWAHAAGAQGVQVEVRIAEVPLEDCDRWVSALRSARAAAAECGTTIHVAGD